MPTELVVDTNVLSHKDFLSWVTDHFGAVYVPAVVYAEAARYALMQGEGAAETHDFLVKQLGLRVERMDHRHAQTAAELAHADGAGGGWHNNARDYMIAGHVAGTGRLLVTENLKHFKCLGKAAIPPEEAIRRFPH